MRTCFDLDRTVEIKLLLEVSLQLLRLSGQAVGDRVEVAVAVWTVHCGLRRECVSDAR